MNITEVYRQLRQAFRSPYNGKVYHPTALFAHWWADVITRQIPPSKREYTLHAVLTQRHLLVGYLAPHWTYRPACLLDPTYLRGCNQRFVESLDM